MAVVHVHIAAGDVAINEEGIQLEGGRETGDCLLKLIQSGNKHGTCHDSTQYGGFMYSFSRRPIMTPSPFHPNNFLSQ